jgi:hypothetical protein
MVRSSLHARKQVRGAWSCIEVCDCGTWHVSLGPFAMKIDQAAAEDLREVLATAFRVVQGAVDPDEAAAHAATTEVGGGN